MRHCSKEKHSLSASESEDEMEGGLLLDVVVGEGSTVFELLSSEDESLLIRWNSFLILDLGLDVLNGVSWLDIKSDSLTGKGLNENLHIRVFLVNLELFDLINYTKLWLPFKGVGNNQMRTCMAKYLKFKTDR